MARKRRLHKRYGKKRSSSGGGLLKQNPPPLTDLVEFVVPGFAAFAATRLLTRVAATQLARKKPSWGKHVGAVTSLLSLAAAWWGAHRIKMLEKHHTPIVVGSAIATFQSLIQLYLPALGWMVSDASPQIAEEAASLQIDSHASSLPPGAEYLDEDPNLYTYDDSFDNGRASAVPASAPQSDEEILNDLNLDGANDLNLGSLGAN